MKPTFQSWICKSKGTLGAVGKAAARPLPLGSVGLQDGVQEVHMVRGLIQASAAPLPVQVSLLANTFEAATKGDLAPKLYFLVTPQGGIRI